MSSAAEIRHTLDQALAATPIGILVTFTSHKAANSWRMAAYTLRRSLAKESRAVYPEGHPLHNTSPYDTLVIRYDTPTALIVANEPKPVITTLLAPGERRLYRKPGSSKP